MAQSLFSDKVDNLRLRMNYSSIFLSTMSLLLVVSFGCNQPKPPEIVQLEYIIERDFAEIPTAYKLIPFDIKNIKEFEDYPMSFESASTDNKIVSLDPPPYAKAPPPFNTIYLDRKCALRNSLFHFLIRDIGVDKEAYDAIIQAARSSQEQTARIAIERAVPHNYDCVVKKELFDQFQVFAYPMMTESYLITYRNFYRIDPIGGGSLGTYYVYKNVDGLWEEIFTWTNSLGCSFI